MPCTTTISRQQNLVNRVPVTHRSELGKLAAAAGAVIVTLAGVVMVVTVVAPAAPSIDGPVLTPGTRTVTPATGAPLLPPARPTGLEIPSIGLSIGWLVELSLTTNGSMEVPGEARSVGWFPAGRRPERRARPSSPGTTPAERPGVQSAELRLATCQGAYDGDGPTDTS